jgi:hypothetical protein
VSTLKKFWEIGLEIFWFIFLASIGSALAVFILQEIWGIYYV